MSPPQWIQELYTPALASLFLERSPEQLQRETSQLTQLLDVRAGARLFDQCCGVGTLSLELAERGYEVFGVDLIEGYIKRATQEALERGLKARFTCADAARYQAPAEGCDAAFNWWTSFGHGGPASDQMMIERSFEALRSGGRFALDYMNVPQVLSELLPAHVMRRELEGEPVALLRETCVDVVGGWMHKRWTYVSEARPAHHVESKVKLYMPWEVKAMMERAGFINVRCYGGLDAHPLERLSPRLICVGVKP
jgi:SAM-dependent methyltransferase